MKLPKGPFDIIVADPPWKFKTWSEKGMSKSAENHYDTLTTDQIARMKLPVGKNALLLLWATSPMVLDAIRVLQDWGFIYKSSFVWDKKIISHGFWNRGQHEFVLIGRRGTFPIPPGKHRRSSVISEQRTRHSAKPEALQDWVDTAYPKAKKLELFARRKRKGWTVWGNEV